MIHARPNTLSLAMAIAVSSSIISTQALADRKLQTKSINILVNGHEEYVHSEVMVGPTLGPDEQPIPKSYTTTYSDHAIDRDKYDLPALSYTQLFSVMDSGVSSVDLFETGRNDVAQKYTKVLKVGNEGIFRFTHNLEETKLVIEVRAGMTDQDSVEAIRAQFPWPFHVSQPFEPLTKIASPVQLAKVLIAVSERAGNLGPGDHYVALATIEVEKVEVNGRTFMRLIASGDQPPELQRLGQSLFVNDDALLAAATSAYIQVHVVGEDLQQQALNELLAHSKPVGYVVHAGDDTLDYPVPSGYPKLEVAEAQGEVIVFRGQKLNPNDIAFVENLHNLWKEAEGDNAAPAAAQVKKYQVKSYRYVIRSRQMAILEKFVARYGAEISEDQPTPLTNEDKLATHALAFYEYLQQALASAIPDQATPAVKFEFTLEHIRAASSVITPIWLQIQLTRHFSFRPVLRGLLNNQNFVQGIMNLIPVVDESQLNASCNDDQFAFKVLSDMARQLIERESMLAEQLAREGKLIRVSNQLKLILEKATTSEKQKLIVLQLKQQAEHELEQLRGVSERQQSLLRKFGQKVERIPELEKQIRNARAEATKARNARLAEELGIEDWDDSQPPENQARLISIKIHAINQALAATEQPEGDSTETTLAAVQHQNARTNAESKASYATIAAHLNLQNFDTSANIDAQLDHLLWRIEALNTQLQGKHILNLQQKSLFDKFQSLNTQGNTLDENQQHLLQKIQALNAQCCMEEPDVNTRQDGLALTLRIRLDEDSTMEEHPALKTAMYERFSSLEYLEEELQDIRTPGHPKAMPVVLEKLSNVEKALKMDNLNSQDDVYYRRNAISEAIQASLAKARQQEEEVALKILKTVEEILKIEVNNEDHKTARLDRIRTKLDSGDVSESMVDKIEHSLRKEDIIFTSKRGNTKLRDLQSSLEFYVEKVNRLAIIEQTKILKVLEDKLHIYEFVRDEADEKGKAFVAKLANDLGVILRRKAHLPENKYVLENKILALMEEVDETYGNEDVRRNRNNEIAHQLNIKTYEDDATIDDQNILIKEKLRELYKAVPKVGDATVNEHIAAIEGELDRQIARLGPKPRYVLDRELARARRVLEEAGHELAGLYRRLNNFRGKHVLFAEKPDDLQHQSEAVSVAEDTLADPHKAILHAIEESLSRKSESSDTYEQRVNALRNKQLQLGGYDGSGGKIQQLIQERVRLGREIETREADFERMKKDLKAAEKAVKNDGGPFQFSTRQVNVLADMNTFIRQHSLKQQALDAALGLTESAFSSGKTIPCLTTFDFDDEYAPIRLQALVGDDLTFNQASRIVEVFKSLMMSFPLSSPVVPLEDQPQNVIKQVQALADRARNEMKTGAQQYDDEIRGMGERAIHFVEHESGDLKGFSEYFSTHSANGNKVLALLREGLISKTELENYMKAARGADGYQTVDEFEHFLDYKHGVNLPHFKKVVQMLSDKGTEEFMQSAFTPVTITATGPAGMKASVAGMKEYAAAVIANYVLDDIAFENGRRTAAFLANVQDTLTPYANAAGLSESELIKAIHGTLMQAHAAAVEQQLNDYWVKPSAFLAQAVTWYFSSYKPLLATHTVSQTAALSLSNMSFLYLLDLTNRGDYTHRMLTPFQHWLERYGVDRDRSGQYAFHTGIEKITELGGLAMPLGKAASSVILLRTGSLLFNRQYNANPRMYRSISRLVPEIVQSMASGQGVQVPLLHKITPEKVKTLASATAGLVLGPVATVGAYAHGLLSGFTYAQTFGFALASSLTFDFFMNDNKILTQWLGGPLGRSLDKINRWRGVGETEDDYVKRTAIATPQRFSETDTDYANRVRANHTMPGWTRNENYLQFRERRDRTIKMFANGWEKYFRENVPKWSFSHAESIPYFYTLGAFYDWQKGDDQKVHGHEKRNYHQSSFPPETSRSP